MKDEKNFLKVSKRIEGLNRRLRWKVPAGTDMGKGELGLFPKCKWIKPWQIPRSSAKFLEFMVRSTGSKVILELGTAIGYSTIWLGKGATETGGHVYGTEVFKPKIELAKKHFKEAGLTNYITLYEKDILQVLKNWDKEKKIDFVFMDADKQNYHKYIELLLPLLKKSSLIVVDNVGDYPQYMSSFLKLVNKLTKSGKIISYTIKVDHGLMLIKKV